ncbi:uncharacterized protein LOC113854956 isoform X3 [Abrus precatorius]|uniref:Uncharacterized protein LOC113854956 isoform X3 n=1 Tax=Abrus precatorius TaxID=3816 RepID=A0A8B8KEA6_ABRPR|nr:uncharacterized protein LOC113854956 isoform X3 [Abrus precatorius]
MSEVDFDFDHQRHPRLFIPNFLSLQECKELEFIHKSCSSVGYRPNVFSTTLSHLIATNSSHFIIPFILIRERLKDKLEEFFKCEYELFIEFTGLISWSKGASIGWHSDDNRPYLKQRHFSDGEPTLIMPKAGDVVMYTADERNIHSVDEITEGERLTLALWFSRNGSHDEDTQLISLLSQHLCFNICWARLHVLGYDTYISQDSSCKSDVSELLVKPVRLVRGNELLDQEFVNILHALQVVHFYCWEGSALQTKVSNIDSKVVKLTDVQREKISGLNSVLLNDVAFVSRVFHGMPSKEKGCICFDWTGIVAAAAAWEDYAVKLSKQIHLQLPYWKMHESIYNVQLGEYVSHNRQFQEKSDF